MKSLRSYSSHIHIQRVIQHISVDGKSYGNYILLKPKGFPVLTSPI